MIISRIIGGLGNQLFQYAAGRSLSLLHNTEFKLDVTAFDEYKLRDFDLLNFKIDAGFATPEEMSRLLPASIFERSLQHLFPLRKRKYYREKEFHFNNEFLALGPDVYLKGYFQSEKYFLFKKESLLRELEIKQEAIREVQLFYREMNNSQSVAIHIRRGDFLVNKSSTEYHGILPPEYYISAVKLIKSKISSPSFYIFSDDIKSVKDNFKIDDVIYVSGKITSNHIEDLYLMSRCKHNIIANSSFSWWAAWLNNNPGKIVIAPKKWFNKGPKNTQDLIPESWIKL